MPEDFPCDYIVTGGSTSNSSKGMTNLTLLCKLPFVCNAIRRLIGSLRARPLRDQLGQAYVEYMLVVVSIAIILIIVVALLGHKVSDVYNNIANAVPG
jgi:Flp pilus assembly pilin Flp